VHGRRGKVLTASGVVDPVDPKRSPPNSGSGEKRERPLGETLGLLISRGAGRGDGRKHGRHPLRTSRTKPARGKGAPFARNQSFFIHAKNSSESSTRSSQTATRNPKISWGSSPSAQALSAIRTCSSGMNGMGWRLRPPPPTKQHPTPPPMVRAQLAHFRRSRCSRIAMHGQSCGLNTASARPSGSRFMR